MYSKNGGFFTFFSPGAVSQAIARAFTRCAVPGQGYTRYASSQRLLSGSFPLSGRFPWKKLGQSSWEVPGLSSTPAAAGHLNGVLGPGSRAPGERTDSKSARRRDRLRVKLRRTESAPGGSIHSLDNTHFTRKPAPRSSGIRRRRMLGPLSPSSICSKAARLRSRRNRFAMGISRSISVRR